MCDASRAIFARLSMSSMAKWLGCPTGILEGHGFDARCGIQKFSF